MNDEELIMKYKETELKYKEMFKNESNIFPNIWDNLKNIEVKEMALEAAISRGKTVVELDPDNQIIDLDNEMTISKNAEKIRLEMIENAKKALDEYGK